MTEQQQRTKVILERSERDFNSLLDFIDSQPVKDVLGTMSPDGQYCFTIWAKTAPNEDLKALYHYNTSIKELAILMKQRCNGQGWQWFDCW